MEKVEGGEKKGDLRAATTVMQGVGRVWRRVRNSLALSTSEPGHTHRLEVGTAATPPTSANLKKKEVARVCNQIQLSVVWSPV